MSDDHTEPTPEDDGTTPADEHAWVGDLLRGDRVEVDPVRRERAIAAALAAADPAPSPGPGADEGPGAPVTAVRRPPRARRAQRLVAAAAIVAVAGVGAVVLSIGTRGGEDTASAPGSADSAQESLAADDEADVGRSTTAAADPGASAADLGLHPDTGALLDAVVGTDASVRAPEVGSTDGEQDEAVDGAGGAPCLTDDGTELIGTARVGTDPASATVVVVVSTAGTDAVVVLDAVTCEAIDRRAL